MVATVKKKRDEIPINRDVLRWARERIDLSYDDAAEGARVKPQQIEEWESGPKAPTVRQARKLAQVYDRPFLEFFAKRRPTLKEPTLVPDFRMNRETESSKQRHELVEIQSRAEDVRTNALDLYELLGEQPPKLPDKIYAAREADDANATAARVREIIDIPVDEQLGLKASERDGFVKILRNKIEAKGILVVKNSGLQHFGARGMCIFASPLPIIVLSNEAPSAQAFTLVHELGHIARRQSAISGPPGSAPASAKNIEGWCDEFAAAFLIPKLALTRLIEKPSRPAAQIEDEILDKLARAFAVSRHAMLIRLVNLGYVESAYYWNVKRPQFLDEERAYKSKARSKYYGSRYRSSRGDLYTGLVLEAWSSGIITNHSAAEFMGIKNIAHLDAIRDRFGGR